MGEWKDVWEVQKWYQLYWGLRSTADPIIIIIIIIIVIIELAEHATYHLAAGTHDHS